MSTRRNLPLRTPYEIQRRARLQPVETWEQKWVIPKNALPGSSYKVLKWVKTNKKQEFSDGEDETAEHTVTADDDVEDARMTSVLPEAEPNEVEGDTEQPDSPAEGPGESVPPTDTINTTTTTPAGGENTVGDEEEEEEEREDVNNLHDPAGPVTLNFPLLDTGADQILQSPAPDGPSLAEISHNQLVNDAIAFDAAPPSQLQEDGILTDEAVQFAIGEP